MLLGLGILEVHVHPVSGGIQCEALPKCETFVQIVFGRGQTVRSCSEKTPLMPRTPPSPWAFQRTACGKIARFLKKSPDAGTPGRMGRPLLPLCALAQVPEKTQQASWKTPVDSTNSSAGRGANLTRQVPTVRSLLFAVVPQQYSNGRLSKIAYDAFEKLSGSKSPGFSLA